LTTTVPRGEASLLPPPLRGQAWPTCWAASWRLVRRRAPGAPRAGKRAAHSLGAVRPALLFCAPASRGCASSGPFHPRRRPDRARVRRAGRGGGGPSRSRRAAGLRAETRTRPVASVRAFLLPTDPAPYAARTRRGGNSRARAAGARARRPLGRVWLLPSDLYPHPPPPPTTHEPRPKTDSDEGGPARSGVPRRARAARRKWRGPKLPKNVRTACLCYAVMGQQLRE
jgi:hypothetical protein